MPTLNDESEVLLEIAKYMRQMLDGKIKPYDAAIKIWETSMIANNSEATHSFWLIWGALTDWVERRPSEAEEAELKMLRASEEWLSLGFENVKSRQAYFDRWIYDEMGYKKGTI